MSKLSDWLVQPIIEEDITKNSKIKKALKRLIDKNLLPKSYSTNVNKLVKRYPGGEFDVHYSENRKEGDL